MVEKSILLCILIFGTQVMAAEKFVDHRSFVPEKHDYYIELGATWEKRNLYWLGGGYGRHVGRCLLTESQTCQQYIDVFGGSAGRDGLTGTLFLLGPRWQFVNFPSSVSPSVRVFGGVFNVRDEVRDKSVFAYGGSYGLTLSVHERVDVRIEARVGYADEMWYQSVVAIHVKADQFVDYFADKIKSFGKSAVDTTGDVLKKTGKAIGDVLLPDSEEDSE